jgi:hypothetical protein
MYHDDSITKGPRQDGLAYSIPLDWQTSSDYIYPRYGAEYVNYKEPDTKVSMAFSQHDEGATDSGNRRNPLDGFLVDESGDLQGDLPNASTCKPVSFSVRSGTGGIGEGFICTVGTGKKAAHYEFDVYAVFQGHTGWALEYSTPLALAKTAIPLFRESANTIHFVSPAKAAAGAPTPPTTLAPWALYQSLLRTSAPLQTLADGYQPDRFVSVTPSASSKRHHAIGAVDLQATKSSSVHADVYYIIFPTHADAVAALASEPKTRLAVSPSIPKPALLFAFPQKLPNPPHPATVVGTTALEFVSGPVVIVAETESSSDKKKGDLAGAIALGKAANSLLLQADKSLVDCC